MKILYKYPSRSRPYKLFTSLNKFYSIATHWDFSMVITLDEDDESMSSATSQEQWYAYTRYNKQCPIVDWGISTGKVNAINRNMDQYTDWDIMVLLSDDMELLSGFDTQILKAFEDGFSGLAHFPDGVVNSKLCTFSVMDKKYFDLFGWIYNPVYQSVFCDNEQHELAVMLGRYKYIPVQIVRHLHPCYGMAPTDDLYKRNEDPILYGKDGKTYQEQKANFFFYHKYMKR